MEDLRTVLEKFNLNQSIELSNLFKTSTKDPKLVVDTKYVKDELIDLEQIINELNLSNYDVNLKRTSSMI